MYLEAHSATKSSTIEIEEKFVVPCDIEKRLMQWGFARQHCMEMTDWYFDTPSLQLLQQNVWLRCRQPERNGVTDDISRWQIKIGQRTDSNPRDGSGASATTVYVEIEGVPALAKAVSYISSPMNSARCNECPNFLDVNSELMIRNHTIPKIPNDVLLSQLLPLARIYARRTSWSILDVTVDLDETDFGHAVGEVEMVVEDETRVEAARSQVREWAAKLQDPASITVEPSVAMGKLEYYLYHYRPSVYEFCLQSGVLG
ncbi:thiamine-triphosphatase [Fistulifera solaris]|uniref:Thiamine-triphosphatase n=1 Tax=Fistulifera solaris TaxID=1519565 RepID=A0A1Z5J8V9_FISSO|nr:thiamine-triphosphatase [Fistulifera solaris]|eukprot:GAX10389.1 thiamine-triphosphatase [Fistulifera solaris]